MTRKTVKTLFIFLKTIVHPLFIMEEAQESRTRSDEVRVSSLSKEQALAAWNQVKEFTVVYNKYSSSDPCLLWTGGLSIKEIGYPVTTLRKNEFEKKGSYLVHLLKVHAEGNPLPEKGITHYSHLCHNKRCLKHYVIESVADNRARINCPKEVVCPCDSCKKLNVMNMISMCNILHPGTSCIYPANFWKDRELWTEDEKKALPTPKMGRPSKRAKTINSTQFKA